MQDIKKILKEVGITQKEFSEKIGLSRPTLDTYIQIYESGKSLPKKKYNIIFDRLFGQKEIEKETFIDEFQKIIKLLERDSKYGVSDLSPEASDWISRIVDQMRLDLKASDWNEDVYLLIEMLLNNYRRNKTFDYLAAYFVFLNGLKPITEIENEQIPYLANLFKAFHHLSEHPTDYNDVDYKMFINRCNELQEEERAKQEQKKELLKKYVHQLLVEFEKKNIDFDENDLREILNECL